MRLIAILFALGILLFGCAQQAEQAPNATGNNVTAPGTAPPPATTQPGAVPPATTPPASNGTPPHGKAPPPDMENVTAVFTIHIKNFAFEPSEVTVPSGAKVVWVNDDSVQHRIGGAAFGSPTLANGDTYGRVFTEGPGTYPYSCAIHPSMQGKIIVTK